MRELGGEPGSRQGMADVIGIERDQHMDVE